MNLVKQIELIRDKVVFTHSEKGSTDTVVNLSELSDKWQYFTENTANTIPFFNELKLRSPETVVDFIKNGNNEFINSTELGSTS